MAASASRSPCCGASSTAMTSRLMKTAHAAEEHRADVWNSAGAGSPSNSISIPRNSFSSTKPALPPVWLEPWPLSARAPPAGRHPSRPLQVGHAHRRSAPARARRDEGFRPTDHRRPVRGMGGEMFGPRPLARRYRRHGQFARHKADRVEQLISPRGRIPISAAHSPDMNPIEKALSS